MYNAVWFVDVYVCVCGWVGAESMFVRDIYHHTVTRRCEGFVHFSSF